MNIDHLMAQCAQIAYLDKKDAAPKFKEQGFTKYYPYLL